MLPVSSSLSSGVSRALAAGGRVIHTARVSSTVVPLPRARWPVRRDSRERGHTLATPLIPLAYSTCYYTLQHTVIQKRVLSRVFNCKLNAARYMEGTAGRANTRCHPNSLICLRTSRSPSLLLIVSRLSRRSFPRARPICSLSLFCSLKYALSLGAQRRKVSSRAHGCTAGPAQHSAATAYWQEGWGDGAGTDPVPVSQRRFACCECGGLTYPHSRREDQPQTARVASGGTALPRGF